MCSVTQSLTEILALYDEKNPPWKHYTAGECCAWIEMIPVTKMNRELLNQIDVILEAVISAAGTVQAMICDNNWIKTVDGKVIK